MDKLRALEYFVAAAQEQSFSAAARRLEVSIPAVAKLIAALERDLGARLFTRSSRGLRLTADGESYLEHCEPLLGQLALADAAVASSRPRGTLVVGAPAMVAQHCLLPALPSFHARYPEVQIDIRNVTTIGDAQADGVDVSVLFGWFEVPALVSRRIGQTRFAVCASPGYWASHGVPLRPKDLEQHVCALFRFIGDTVDDVWRFERKGEQEVAAVRGWLVSRHRDVVLDAALAGEAVARLTDLTIRPHLQLGRLVPVLSDWESKDAPPVTLLYRPSSRRITRVRLFIDFVTALFRDLDAARAVGGVPQAFSQRPPWWGHRGRASSTVRST